MCVYIFRLFWWIGRTKTSSQMAPYEMPKEKEIPKCPIRRTKQGYYISG
jgi:hypothetical protein